jgi:hypothetical protein
LASPDKGLPENLLSETTGPAEAAKASFVRKQARILNRSDREILDQVDLLVSKEPDLPAKDVRASALKLRLLTRARQLSPLQRTFATKSATAEIRELQACGEANPSSRKQGGAMH